MPIKSAVGKHRTMRKHHFPMHVIADRNADERFIQASPATTFQCIKTRHSMNAADFSLDGGSGSSKPIAHHKKQNGFFVAAAARCAFASLFFSGSVCPSKIPNKATGSRQKQQNLRFVPLFAPAACKPASGRRQGCIYNGRLQSAIDALLVSAATFHIVPFTSCRM